MLTPIMKNENYLCPHCQKELISFEENKIINLNGKSIFNKTYEFKKEKSNEEDLFIYKNEDRVKMNNALDLVYILEGECDHCKKPLYSAQHWYSLKYRKHFLNSLLGEDNGFFNIDMDNIILSYKFENEDLILKSHHRLYENKEDLISDINDYSSNLFFTAKNFIKDFELVSLFKSSTLEKEDLIIIKNAINKNQENIICHVSSDNKYEVFEFSTLSENYIDIFKYILQGEVQHEITEDATYIFTYDEKDISDSVFIKKISELFEDDIFNIQIEINNFN